MAYFKKWGIKIYLTHQFISWWVSFDVSYTHIPPRLRFDTPLEHSLLSFQLFLVWTCLVLLILSVKSSRTGFQFHFSDLRKENNQLLHPNYNHCSMARYKGKKNYNSVLNKNLCFQSDLLPLLSVPPLPLLCSQDFSCLEGYSSYTRIKNHQLSITIAEN